MRIAVKILIGSEPLLRVCYLNLKFRTLQCKRWSIHGHYLLKKLKSINLSRSIFHNSYVLINKHNGNIIVVIKIIIYTYHGYYLCSPLHFFP